MKPAYTASFNSLAGRKATFLLAAIWMVSPVAGLRPCRAGRSFTSRMPRPFIRMRSPFFRCLVTDSTIAASRALACFLGMLCPSAIASNTVFSVIVAAAAFFCGAAREGVFVGLAAAFADFFLAAPAVAAAFFPLTAGLVAIGRLALFLVYSDEIAVFLKWSKRFAPSAPIFSLRPLPRARLASPVAPESPGASSLGTSASDRLIGC